MEARGAATELPWEAGALPLRALDQLEGQSGTSRRLLGTWDGNWKCGRSEGPETVLLQELVQGKFEETDRKTGQNCGGHNIYGLGREDVHEEGPRER